MNNFFIKTTEACIPVYTDKNGDLQVDYHSTACDDYGPSSSIWWNISPFIGLIIFGLILFFLIRKRKNIQKKFLRMLNLIGITIVGILFLWTLLMSISFLLSVLGIV